MRTRLILLSALVALSACTHKEIYTEIQNNRDRECEKLIYDSEVAECRAGLEPSYERYKDEQERLRKPKPYKS